MQKPKVHLSWELEIQFLEYTLLGLLTLFLAMMAPNPISPFVFTPGLFAPVVGG